MNFIYFCSFAFPAVPRYLLNGSCNRNGRSSRMQEGSERGRGGSEEIFHAAVEGNAFADGRGGGRPSARSPHPFPLTLAPAVVALSQSPSQGRRGGVYGEGRPSPQTPSREVTPSSQTLPLLRQVANAALASSVLIPGQTLMAPASLCC